MDWTNTFHMTLPPLPGESETDYYGESEEPSYTPSVIEYPEEAPFSPAEPVVINILTTMRDTADVILKASDGIHFPVHKLLLAGVSPFFRTMFTLPQPPTSNPGPDLPTIDMMEASEVLSLLLHHIYPVPVERPVDLRILRDALYAATKFDMDIVISALRLELRSSRFLDADPFGVYAIALGIVGLEEEARVAARATLKFDWPSLLASREHIGSMLALDLLKLFDLRNSHATAAKLLLENFLIRCQKCNSRLYSCWLYQWKTAAVAEMDKRPVTDTIFSLEFIWRYMDGTATCAHCKAKTTNSHWDFLWHLDEGP